MKCITCGKETTNPRFCSNSCSAKWSNKHREYTPANDNRTKEVICVKCKTKFLTSVYGRSVNAVCQECRIVKLKNRYKLCVSIGSDKERYLCKSCGQEKCLRPNICKKKRVFPSLIKYFGFDETSIGTVRVYEEFERIKNKLIEDYYDNKKSTLELENFYNCKCHSNFLKILNNLDIKRRTLSDSLSNAFVTGRKSPSTNIKYKHGHHNTWNGKKVFYRSSYELDYCKELDEKKIDYEMENLRILYWDSQLLRQRIAIPDFHLTESNTIAEVKSTYTYDDINMNDKIKAYKEHGYKFKLILEHKEIT